MNPAIGSTIRRAYLASIVLVGFADLVWFVAYATDTIDSLRIPWDSLIYGAVIVMVATLAVTGTLAVVTSSAGRWRLLALAPLGAVGFLWWVLIFYGQATSGIGGGSNRDLIAEFAVQPIYVPVMTALTLLIGLPLVVPWVRAQKRFSRGATH